MKLPLSRNENVVVQDAGKEVLIYDLLTNQAYCLNETSAIIYQACDGKTTVDELKRRTRFTDDLIFLALDDLQKHNLCKDLKINHFAGLSRREVIRKVGFASMVALPIISSVIAPQAVDAQSGSTCVCPTYSGECICDVRDFNVGCFLTDLACQNAAIAIQTTVCCSRSIFAVKRDLATGCCIANCGGCN